MLDRVIIYRGETLNVKAKSLFIRGLKPLLQTLIGKATPAALDGETKPRPPTIVLSIDQGEELFLAEAQDEAQPLLALLRELLASDPPAVIAVFTIRSDNYERLQEARELEGIAKVPFDLGPMPQGSYAEVINGPARRKKCDDDTAWQDRLRSIRRVRYRAGCGYSKWSGERRKRGWSRGGR